MRKLLVLLSILTVLIAASVVAAQEEAETFELTIMHTNDTHTWWDPQSSGDTANGGGIALQAGVVNAVRADVENSLLLDAGDRFTGTLYQASENAATDNARVMNALGYDAMTLGNHEFDFGEDALLQFLNAVEFPVVSANVEFGGSAELGAIVAPYTTIEVGGEQIGVIGLTTPDTPTIASPSDETVFNEDMAAVVNDAAEALTAEGVNKIILVTHTGINADMELAPDLTGVDVIVGGHSHTLLSNLYGAVAATDAEGNAFSYPMELAGADDAPILYVQSGERNVFLGRLDLTFDAEGVVEGFSGDTIFLSQYVAQDEEVGTLIAELSANVVALRETSTGATVDAELIGDRAVCRVEECDLGNIIAEALLYETRREEDGFNAQIAIMNGGGIRANIDAGEVTVGDVFTVLPFGNTVATFEAPGGIIREALENGVSSVTVENGQVLRAGASGRFPQVAGLRFTFDPTQEPGSRVTSIEVQNEDGTFTALDDNTTYRVVTNNFTRTGGDSYSMFTSSEVTNVYDAGRPLNDVLVDYLINTPPFPGEILTGRITIEGAELAPIE